MTFDEYKVEAINYRRANPSQRLGQAYFNFLWICRPDLSEQIRGDHSIDPFYKVTDDDLNKFLEWVKANW